MNVLIINLTRFGDLIQTQPVISGYNSLGHTVGLVCLENFASATAMLDGVHTPFSFPGAKLLADLEKDWRLAVKEAKAFKSSVLNNFSAERVVNLTPSVATRLQTYDLAAGRSDVAGFCVDEFGFNADVSPWAAFLQLAGGNRGASPFNICDIFRRTAGLDREGNELALAQPNEEIMTEAAAMLGKHAHKDAKGWIALQMGASEDRRRWPVKHFAAVADMLWERDKLMPVLLGTKGEAELGERFETLAQCPSANLIGETSLTQLGAVLRHSTGLVTNDTGTMHLAAGLAVPVCAVFLATAQPWDTGPYRAGNICLEPDMSCHPCEFGKPCEFGNRCRESVTPECVYAALFTAIDDAPLVAHRGARVWRSRIGEDGFMDLESLSGHDGEERTVWIRMQRGHYLPFLDGKPVAARTGLAQELSVETAAELSKTLTSGHDMLFLLSQQGMLLARNPREQAKTKFLQTWQRFQNVMAGDGRLNILGSLWMFQTQQCGDNLSALLQITEKYKGLFASLKDEFA